MEMYLTRIHWPVTPALLNKRKDNYTGRGTDNTQAVELLLLTVKLLGNENPPTQEKS